MLRTVYAVQVFITSKFFAAQRRKTTFVATFKTVLTVPIRHKSF